MANFSIRASSIADFIDCPARWSSKHLEGRRLPSSPPAIIGTAVHASTAEFDHAILEGTPLTVDDAAEALEQLIREPEQEVDWGDMSFDFAMRVGLGAHTRYCVDIAPTQHYVEVEALLPNLEVNVPVDIERDLWCTLELTGTLDRVREVKGKYGVSDIKTGARACTQNPAKHKMQMGVYELLASQGLDYNIELPAQIIQLQTSSDYAAGTAEIIDARGALLGNDQHKGILSVMAAMLMSENFYGNPSSGLCSEKFCPNWNDCFWR